MLQRYFLCLAGRGSIHGEWGGLCPTAQFVRFKCTGKDDIPALQNNKSNLSVLALRCSAARLTASISPKSHWTNSILLAPVPPISSPFASVSKSEDPDSRTRLMSDALRHFSSAPLNLRWLRARMKSLDIPWERSWVLISRHGVLGRRHYLFFWVSQHVHVE